MAEEHRLTAAEFLQYFLSRYKVDNGTLDSDPELGEPPIAEPLAAAGTQDEAETNDDE